MCQILIAFMPHWVRTVINDICFIIYNTVIRTTKMWSILLLLICFYDSIM